MRQLDNDITGLWHQIKRIYLEQKLFALDNLLKLYPFAITTQVSF